MTALSTPGPAPATPLALATAPAPSARRAALVAGASLLSMAAFAAGTAAVGHRPVTVLLFGAVILLDVVAACALHAALRDRGALVSGTAAAFRLVYSAAFAAVLAPVAVAYLRDADSAAAWTTFDHAWPVTMALFGPHLVLVGWLLWGRGRVTAVIAGLLAVAGFCYVLDPALGVLGMDGARSALAVVLGISGAVGEIGLAVWLLVRGGGGRGEAARPADATP